MKKIYTTLSLLFTLSLSALATNYVVTGSFNDNGTYIETGTCNGKPAYVMTSGSNTYSIIWNGSQWAIGQSFGGCSNFGDYTNPAISGTPPATGWTGCCSPITVIAQARTISYNPNYLVENVANDGSIAGNVIIRYNKFNGDTFTGTAGENYITNGKVVLSNVPAGLTGMIIKNNDSTLTLSFTGNATSHTNLDNKKIRIDFLNTSVSGADTSVVIGHADSLQIYFRDILTVAHAGADFDSISKAITASTPYDIIDIWAGTYTESNLTVPYALTFKGHGADVTVIQAGATPYTATNRVFTITSTDWIEYKDIAVQNGNFSTGDAFGGGIYGGNGITGASIRLTNCRISDNQVTGSHQTLGGGVFTQGDVEIYNCEFSGNKASGTSAEGGALRAGGQVTIVNSTFSNNFASTNGGAISLSNGGGNIGTIINSTITNNMGSNAGGGICTSSGITFKNVILYGNNVSGGDLYQGASEGNATNCIMGTVYGNPLNSNVNGSNANPMLSALTNNGGTTQTHALQAGSPAINAGTTGFDIPTTDQRGYSANGIRDIGAYEYNGCANVTVANPQTICANSSYSFNNHTYSTAGNYNDTLHTFLGCDSIVVTTIRINPIDTTHTSVSICSGTSHTFYGTSLTTTGMYYHTLITTMLGCDSVIALNLVVNPIDTTHTNVSICSGASHTFYGANLTTVGMYYHTLANNVTGCDSVIALNLIINPIDTTHTSVSICSGASHTFYGTNLTTAGTYYHTLANSVTGCDSIIALSLTMDTIDLAVTVSHDTIISNQLNATSYQWLNCDNGNMPINNATQQWYIAAQSGSYAVVVTKGACSDTSLCQHIILTGINELSNNQQLIVYPNPATSILTITNITHTTTLRLYDALGKLVIMKETAVNTALDISNLAHGVYTLVSDNSKGRAFNKVVIAK